MPPGEYRWCNSITGDNNEVYMNYSKAKQKMRMLINDYSRRGEIIEQDASNIMDDTIKFRHYLDIAQKVVSNVVYIKKNIEVSLINENWIETDNPLMYESEEYNGKIIYDINNKIVYRVIENSLHELTNTYLPINGRYIIKMPDAFYKLLSVRVACSNEMRSISNAQWISSNELVIPGYYSGNAIIEYAKYPDEIPDNGMVGNREYEFEIKETAQSAMIYYASALVLQLQNITAYYQLMKMYEEVLLNIDTNEGTRQHKVVKKYV